MRTHVCLAAVLICCLAPVRALELDESSYDSAVSGRVKQHYATGVESYDPFLGKLTMRHVDLVLPGNGGLDLVLQRVFDNGELKLFSREPPEALGNGWRMHMGRLLVEEPSVCNPRYGTKVAYLAPDGSRQSFYRADRDALWISKSFWAIRCSERVPRMISPAGVTYEFGYNKDQYTYHLTRIVDRNGNWLLVDYHGFPADIEQRLIDTITSSDGRAVTFRYDALNTETGGGDNSGLVHTSRLTGIEIGDTGIAISYGYSGNPYHAAVTRVTLANGQTWHFRYHRLYEFPASVTLHRFAGYIDSSVSPSGRSAQYRYHANAQAYDVDVIVEGAGEWRHRSERGTWSVTATVQSPYYCERREYSRDRDDVWLWGSLRAEWLYDTRDCSGDPAQSITHEYDWLYVSADTDTITAAPGTTYGHGDTYAAVPAKRRTFRDATEYVTQRGDYDTYGNPGWIREWSPNGELRETRFTYFTDVGPWHVNGLPLTEVVSGIAGGIDRSYDASGNLVSETVYGTRTGFEYTTDGDVSAVIDALGRRHSYGDYHRGVPRAESLANGASIARAPCCRPTSSPAPRRSTRSV